PLDASRRLPYVGHVGRNLDLVVLVYAQRQRAGDALSVHPWAVAGGVTHPDLGREPAGFAGEHRRRPGVQSDRVHDFHAQLPHLGCLIPRTSPWAETAPLSMARLNSPQGTPIPMSGSPFLTASAAPPERAWRASGVPLWPRRWQPRRRRPRQDGTWRSRPHTSTQSVTAALTWSPSPAVLRPCRGGSTHCAVRLDAASPSPGRKCPAGRPRR